MTVAFTPEAERQIAEVLTRYPEEHRGAALIPVLYIAQAEFGYLTLEVMELVAERLGLPPSRVMNTATFYTMLRKKPVGQHHLQVCTNVSCWLRGADRMLAHLEERLGVNAGETTADKRFTLDECECLGSCGTAPAMQVGDEYVEELTIEKLDALLARLRNVPEQKPKGAPK